MKNIKLLILPIILIISNLTTAQFRPFVDEDPNNQSNFEQPIGIIDPDGGNFDPNGPIVDPFGEPFCCDFEDEFSFFLNFASITAVTNLFNRIRQENFSAAVEAWAIARENDLKNEIERQLNMNISSFSEARERFFNHWARESVDELTPALFGNLENRIQAKKDIQKPFRTNYYNIQTWENLGARLHCNGNAQCEEYANRNVNGRSIRSYALNQEFLEVKGNQATLLLREQFDLLKLAQEFDGLTEGISRIRGNIGGRHVNFIRNQNRINEVLYMYAYLVLNNNNIYNQGFRFSSGFTLPTLVSNNSILSEGRNREPDLDPISLILEKGIITFEDGIVEIKLNLGPGDISRYNRIDLAIAKPIIFRLLDNTLVEGYFNDVLQGIPHACADYQWSSVGDSWTVNITDIKLAFTLRNTEIAPTTKVNFNNLCITIPKRRNVPGGQLLDVSRDQATQQLNIAFDRAFAATGRRYVDERLPRISIVVATALLQNLKGQLSLFAGGVAVTNGPCAGNINSTRIKFCN